jgi:hypothetical protein
VRYRLVGFLDGFTARACETAPWPALRRFEALQLNVVKSYFRACKLQACLNAAVHFLQHLSGDFMGSCRHFVQKRVTCRGSRFKQDAKERHRALGWFIPVPELD